MFHDYLKKGELILLVSQYINSIISLRYTCVFLLPERNFLSTF